MIKYIIIDSGSSASRLMFYDVKKMNNAYETSEIFRINSFFLRFINKIHMSGKLNSIVSLPFKSIWDRYYITEITLKSPETEYIIIFTNVSVKKFRLGYLKKLESRTNVKLVLVAVDSFVDKNLSALRIRSQVKFDLVYSFDPKDCKKYNMLFTNSLYSRRENIFPSKTSCDIFFIGRAKDRYNDLLEIAQMAINAGLKINFQILGVEKKSQITLPGITYLKKVKSYEEVLPMIMSTKCLLDLYQLGQTGLTMRAYEAIFYNKLLLTNNDYTSKLAYFNPNFMQIFKNINEIEFSFINQSSNVNYEYNDEYSPVHFLKQIEKDLLKKGKLQ